MGHAGVEQPAHQSLRALGPRHGLAGGELVDEPGSGGSEPEQAQGRATDEHRSPVDATHPRIEHDPPIRRQRCGHGLVPHIVCSATDSGG